MLLFVALPACAREAAEEAPPPVEVHCVAPRLEGIDETVSLRGRVEPPPGGDLPLASQVAGRVVSVAVHEGQRIVKGDLVATVDGAASRDALRQADAAVAQARTAETNARATLERTKSLVARGIAATQELDDANAREDTALANITAVTAGSDVARRTLGRVLVRSDFDGVVTHLFRGPGSLVDGTAATPVLQLAADSAMNFVADATERELGRLREGQHARITLASSSDGFDATVVARATALDAQTGLGVLRLAFSGTPAGVPIGAFGRVVVSVAHRDGALVLPSAAVRGASSDGAEVALCDGAQATLRTIEVGFRDDARVEVKSGLVATDRVAVDHVLGLDDRAPLKVLP
ncbi:MAG TPA: efflux RND transporter periplasmic adaptor subunit [Polyangiaceae bacterium]|nr:efflux RND transporter periplasmic adaptor subunit [Polyangiaceae bacterium]